MVYAVPYAGYIIQFVCSREGILLLLVLPLAGLLALQVRARHSGRRMPRMVAPGDQNAALAEGLKTIRKDIRQLWKVVLEIRAREGESRICRGNNGRSGPL